MKKSRNKGASGEREFCREIGKLLDISWIRRNLAQYQNSGCDLITYPPEGVIVSDREQLIVDTMALFAIEIKRHKRCNPGQIKRWFAQAKKQASGQPQRIPIMAYRADYCDWIIMVPTVPDADSEHCIFMGLRLFSHWLLNCPSRLLISRENDADTDTR